MSEFWIFFKKYLVHLDFFNCFSDEDLRIVSREEWKARPPKVNITKHELPSTRIIILGTSTGNCFELVFYNPKGDLLTM